MASRKHSSDAGPPRVIPYGRHEVHDDDVAAVTEALYSDWLTTGPAVKRFEESLARTVGASHAVAVNSGTAALHCAMHALDIGPGDEVIVPPLTFAASANCVLYQGGTPVFADVDPATLLIDPASVEARITPRTRAVIAVDYAGQPCDYDALHAIAVRHRLAIVADACHSLGASDRARSVGSLAHISAFSFHPVKAITTGEGGMAVTDDESLARWMRTFRNHGITIDAQARDQQGTWYYEMQELGFNYRISDVACALGSSQLARLDESIRRRQEIARAYDEALDRLSLVSPLELRDGVSHARHLYVVRWHNERATIDRAGLFAELRARGLGVNVHYIPVYLHPYYRRRFGTGPGLCPVAEAAYEQIVSLPIYPAMTEADVGRVIDAVSSCARQFARRAA